MCIICTVCLVLSPLSLVQSQPLSPPLKPTATGNKSIHYIFSISDLLIIFIIISLYRQFPARAPLEGTPEFETIHHFVNLHEGGLNRSASLQGCYQIAALFMTLAIAIASGVVIGFILRMKSSVEYLASTCLTTNCRGRYLNRVNWNTQATNRPVPTNPCFITLSTRLSSLPVPLTADFNNQMLSPFF